MAYNCVTQECVRKEVMEKNKRPCGDSQIDVGSQMCCDGKMHDIKEGGDLRCCGQNIYEFAIYDCRDETIVAKGNRACNKGTQTLN